MKGNDMQFKIYWRELGTKSGTLIDFAGDLFSARLILCSLRRGFGPGNIFYIEKAW